MKKRKKVKKRVNKRKRVKRRVNKRKKVNKRKCEKESEQKKEGDKKKVTKNLRENERKTNFYAKASEVKRALFLNKPMIVLLYKETLFNTNQLLPFIA